MPQQPKIRFIFVHLRAPFQNAVESYVKRTIEKYGRLDISAQVAGVSQKQSPVEDLALAEFEKVISVNVRGRELHAHISIGILTVRVTIPLVQLSLG